MRCIPTVTLPTSRVPAMDVLTTGMCSDSSDSNTLHSRRWRSVSSFFRHTDLGCSRQVVTRVSRSHSSPVEVFTGAQCYEGIGAAEHTEDANLIVILKLKTRHHYACTATSSCQTCSGCNKPARGVS